MSGTNHLVFMPQHEKMKELKKEMDDCEKCPDAPLTTPAERKTKGASQMDTKKDEDNEIKKDLDLQKVGSKSAMETRSKIDDAAFKKAQPEPTVTEVSATPDKEPPSILKKSKPTT